jgi:hypothetical protein
MMRNTNGTKKKVKNVKMMETERKNKNHRTRTRKRKMRRPIRIVNQTVSFSMGQRKEKTMEQKMQSL